MMMTAAARSHPLLALVPPVALAVALVAGAATARAQQGAARFENLDRLDGLVATTVGAGIGQPGGAISPIDRRLRLSPCPTMPDVTGPMFGAAIVRCDTQRWRIRVPLAQVARAVPAVAAATAPVIRKGDPVELIAEGASFTLSRTMIADQDGAAGQTIRVRDGEPKGVVIAAQVVEPGKVRVP